MEQIKEEDKFFNRLMSKELASSSSLNTSSHHYYVGASGSVPFLWESQPGTPKHVLFSGNSSLLPPLTPPPSYNSQSTMQMMKKKSKITCLINIFLSWKNIKSSLSSHVSPSSSLSYAPSSNSSPTSSRSSSSSIKSKNHHHQHRRRCQYRISSSRSGDHVHDYDYEEEEEDLDHEQLKEDDHSSMFVLKIFFSKGLVDRTTSLYIEFLTLDKYFLGRFVMRFEKEILDFLNMHREKMDDADD
ncbi:hypothetical protein HS088_TW01G00529 [Tripterygium wilfordii]|uniref:Uncharacterized protein n=1 Tax=Tripterygium wilfordii TaxID=458696 RepID=A0A7J7E2C8_TRIWF|nr:hypothetical protein HS088_TW01G00529 [Tripterygium wilfordii]